MSYVRQKRGSEEVTWLQEEISEDIKWLITIKKVLHSGKSDFQSVELVESGPFKKVLLLDGKAQSAEADEFVYHECLVHPALLLHPNPKTVFICGGGEGATAREVLRHKSVERVVMVDIDKVVCDFCEEHLEANKAAFSDPRLELIIDDARAQLEKADGQFDVIIGDLADPVFGGPCYQLYTQEFYRTVIKTKLAEGGIFVTQSGPAGVLTCTEVFTPIASTLKSVFPSIKSYAAHIPSFVDAWGWNLATSDPGLSFPEDASAIDDLIASRISGDLQFLDGQTLKGVLALNKAVRAALAKETHIYTVENPRFIHGSGVKTLV
ncbi:hypothetical protein WJX73_006141 [Symbiochloris irregularis]|uniref:thermospermine synthase n=1 Tax=Symbiochloris irregularis TaxID=706552 RepID=A0AAW1PTF5_9CHLO